MIHPLVKIAKIGKNVDKITDPNDFIFHSDYNTFKIIREGTIIITLAASTTNQTFTQTHLLNFIPLVAGFAKRDSASQVFLPNTRDVELWGAKLGMTGDIRFNYLAADATNIIFNFDNAKTSSVGLHVRYFCLEGVN